jgi:hypothetical protein
VPRILRNYLISFAIIGLVLLAVHFINRWADRRAAGPPPGLTGAPAAGQK